MRAPAVRRAGRTQRQLPLVGLQRGATAHGRAAQRPLGPGQHADVHRRRGACVSAPPPLLALSVRTQTVDFARLRTMAALARGFVAGQRPPPQPRSVVASLRYQSKVRCGPAQASPRVRFLPMPAAPVGRARAAPSVAATQRERQSAGPRGTGDDCARPPRAIDKAMTRRRTRAGGRVSAHACRRTAHRDQPQDPAA